MATPEEAYMQGVNFIPGLFAAANQAAATGDPVTTGNMIASAIMSQNADVSSGPFSAYSNNVGAKTFDDVRMPFEGMGPFAYSPPDPRLLEGTTDPFDPTAAILGQNIASSGGPASATPVYLGPGNTSRPKAIPLPAVNDERITGLTNDEFDLQWALNYQLGMEEPDIGWTESFGAAFPGSYDHKAPAKNFANIEKILNKAGLDAADRPVGELPGQ